jgi:hypothetical protein
MLRIEPGCFHDPAVNRLLHFVLGSDIRIGAVIEYLPLGGTLGATAFQIFSVAIEVDRNWFGFVELVEGYGLFR